MRPRRQARPWGHGVRCRCGSGFLHCRARCGRAGVIALDCGAGIALFTPVAAVVAAAAAAVCVLVILGLLCAADDRCCRSGRGLACRTQRSSLRALTKWGSNLGWALLPRAGAAFSRRARGAAASLGAFAPRLLARRSLRAPRFVLLSCISVSSFFGFAGTAFFAAFGSCFGAGAAVFAAFAGAVSACFFGASAKFSASGRGFLPRTGSTGRTGAGTPSHG